MEKFKNINSHRVRKRNDADPGDGYVMYWMQSNHRLNYNYALEYAVGWANKLNKPLVIFEELKCDYRWASDRIHVFYMQGMKAHLDICRDKKINYIPFVEDEAGTSKRFYRRLLNEAALLVSDEYPVYFIRERNEELAEELDIPFFTVDSNGMIPLGITEKAPYNAYFFRKIMQKHFVKCFTAPPRERPLDDLKNRDRVQVTEDLAGEIQRSEKALEDIDSFVKSLSIDHSVSRLEIKGTRRAAQGRLGQFVGHSLSDYGEKRNDPDANKVSGLSPWLHFGKISEYEVVKTVLEQQPDSWDLEDITFNDGQRNGFWNGDPGISKFLDELITWREVGFHFCHHTPDYDQFESLPDWARETLEDHEDDPREWNYSLEELEYAETHDELWNAAQNQLATEGIIHNYLRMLWGKKVIEWTPDPRTALDYLIELNNKYAIDGRDPNSYSGIFWCFGRFDRAWQERPIFGKIRYMTSKSTRRKVKLDRYLERYGKQYRQQ